MPGYIAAKPASASGKSTVERLGVAPSLSRPRARPTSSCTSMRALSTSARIRRAHGSSASPAGVSVMLPRARLNRAVPSSRSSAWICLLSEGCATSATSAARVKWRVSATATKYSSCRSCTSIAYGYRNDHNNVLNDSSRVSTVRMSSTTIEEAFDGQSVRLAAEGAQLRADEHRREGRRRAADRTAQRHLRSRRRRPVTAAVVERVPRRDQELRRHVLRPRSPDGERLLALGRGEHPCVGHVTAEWGR